jgi:hypothetical protein
VADLSIPLVNRGAEALEALLNYDEARARENVRLLTFSELLYLAAAARDLSKLAEAVRHETWPMPGLRLQEIVRAAEQSLAEPLRKALDDHLDQCGCAERAGFLHCPEARRLFLLLPKGDRLLLAGGGPLTDERRADDAHMAAGEAWMEHDDAEQSEGDS